MLLFSSEMKFSAKIRSKLREICAFFAIFALFFIVLSVTGASIAQNSTSRANSADSTAHAPAQKSDLQGVKNFALVNSNLLRGAQPTKEGFARLQKMGVAIDVDLRDDGGRERAEVTQLGMQYVSIPSQCYTSLDSSVAKFLTLLRNNAGKKVFVHCRLGTDRTGMMIAAYRMSQEGWSAKEARKEMEAFGYSFEHHVICPGLAQYERDFPHEFATRPEFETLRAAAPASATPQR